MSTVEKICLNCGSDFQALYTNVARGNGKFCSLSCSSRYNGKKFKKKPNVECSYCGKMVYKSPSRIKRTKTGNLFCSNACKAASHKVGTGLKDMIKIHYPNLNYRTICFAEHDKECIICGEDKIVSVHHIDENHHNDDPNNLLPICPTHHQYIHSGKKYMVRDQVIDYLDNKFGDNLDNMVDLSKLIYVNDRLHKCDLTKGVDDGNGKRLEEEGKKTKKVKKALQGTTVDSECRFCGESFPVRLTVLKRGNGKFCSVSCGAKFNARKRNPPKEPNVSCATCGTRFYKTPSRIAKSKSGLFFCNRKCKDSAQRIGGISEVIPSHYGTTKNYRTICFRHHEKKCIVCGEEGIVSVHHYDENHDNNDPSNLVPLCPTHHVYIHSRYSFEIMGIVDNYVKSLNFS